MFEMKILEALHDIEDENQTKNFLLVLYALSLSNHLDDKFDVVVKNLEGRLETYSSDFEQAILRTDEEQRKLLELLLVASIACADVEQTNTTLIYGRENTFLLRLPKKILQIVIDLTDENSYL